VAELEVALNDDSIKAEAGEILRSLIDRVVLTPAAVRRTESMPSFMAISQRSSR